MATQNEPIPKAGSNRGAMLIRILIILAVGAALAVLIWFFLPGWLVREQPQPTHPRLQTGGTSTVYVIVENRWRNKYRDEKHGRDASGLRVDPEKRPR